MTARIVDNKRVKLADVLNELAGEANYLSIATGYWDLKGLNEIYEQIQSFEKIRLLIGQEPIPPQYAKQLDLRNLDATFPEVHMTRDLAAMQDSAELRELVLNLKNLIDQGTLEVKVFRGDFLHAKAYIFGNLESVQAQGIIGSSNFTGAGLKENRELNAVELDTRVVKYRPAVATDEHGHLSWFEELWNSEDAEPWSGKFLEILRNSQLGDKIFDPYLMYIKALYEIYGDELVPEIEISTDVENVLYEFQVRNAKLLIKKLQKNGLAMLADSVGLGKTITAGAVLRHYLEELGARRIYVVAPASLTSQWKEDLAKVHHLVGGFNVISMQDVARVQAERALDQYANVDLFIVDEAHNLRSGSGSRHDELLDWFSDNPESHVLLLTATPINNSLTDFVNQIQLAAKGRLDSFPVVFPTDKKNEVIDFFEAVQRLSSEIHGAEKEGKKPDYEKVNRVMRQGLREFLVRTTRRGIEREFGGVKMKDGILRQFPKSVVEPAPYRFSPGLITELSAICTSRANLTEDVEVAKLKIRSLLEQTQRTQHPFDFIDEKFFTKEQTSSPFERIFQILLLLGFTPYKPDIYQHKYYKKTPEQIRALRLSTEENFAISSQMTIHNMMRITFLKRLESSQYALKKSLLNYLQKLNDFEQLLVVHGRIGRIRDVRALRAEFGDDIEVMDFSTIALSDESVVADPAIFNLDALKADLNRDRGLIELLILICDEVGRSDDKLKSFSTLIEKVTTGPAANKKVLVFSYFADTIEYLQESLPRYFRDESMLTRSAFTNGKTKAQIERLAKRFSPISKNGEKAVEEDGELDILFATDVLSEGQNLQDCAVLVNFDLHWNPVRMIQRNGRINRLGSRHDSVTIYNIHPDVDLDEYLTLVNRLERKIDRIRFTVGTDQSVLGEIENPLEFVDENDDGVAKSTAKLYDSECAGDAFAQLDDDSDLLTEDQYLFDLREFEREASEDERRELSNIPIGKWGSLQARSSNLLADSDALALLRVVGSVEEGGQPFTTHVFVAGSSLVGAVEAAHALAEIRVDRGINLIPAPIHFPEKSAFASRAKIVALLHARKTRVLFRTTPMVTKVLEALKQQNAEIDFHGALSRITTKQEYKRAMSFVRLGQQEL
jgi:SNF2 family DNA or RNA helicase